MQTPDTNPPALPVSPAERELRLSLDALQTSLQGLVGSLDPNAEQAAERSAVLLSALRTLADVDRGTSALCSIAFPEALDCRAHDLRTLMQAVWQRLPETQRARVLLDLENAQAQVQVDGDLFQTSLDRLLQGPLGVQGKTVFVHVVPAEDELYLNLVWPDSAQGSLDFEGDMVLQLALQDMQRMGVEMGSPGRQKQTRCLVLRIPLATANTQQGDPS